MRVHAITWNLFHGRDKPPEKQLFTLRSRLLRIPEKGETHIQVNRNLTSEFAARLSIVEWDVALLQEAPPRFAAPLAVACEAETHQALTSRNSLSPLRRAAARINPDLIASGEGGSNLTLVRPRLGGIAERRELVIQTGPPERRVMAFTRTGSGLCIANLHTTNDRPDLSVGELHLAASTAVEWAGELPLIFGGDLNLRPEENPEAFDDLRESFGLERPTAPHSIDHLLVRGLEIAKAPRAWPPKLRDVPYKGLSVRLSDHAPVEAVFDTP